MSVTEIEIEAQENEDLVCLPVERSDTSYQWYDIDCGMLSPKASYFFQSAKNACYAPYMILFLTGIGLSTEQAGMVNGIRFLGFIVGPPLWGLLADYKQIHLLLIVILCLSSLLLISSQPFLSIPLAGKGICEEDHFNQSLSPARTTNQSVNVNRNSSVNVTMPTTSNENSRQGTNNLFIAMLITNLLGSCFDGPTAGFIDTGVVQRIRLSARPAEFGTQRMFGSVGVAVGAVASSIVVEYVPQSILPCYTSVFILYGVFALCLTVSTFLLFKGIPFTSNVNRHSAPLTSAICREDQGIGTVLRRTVCEFHTIFFLFTVLVVGILSSLYVSFFFLLLKQMNSQNIVMGLCLVVSGISSAICTKLCDKFINLLGGTIRVLCLVTLTLAIRFLLFAYLENPWFALAIQLLHGLGYGLFIPTSVVYIKNISPPGIYTSMYGIFYGLFYGVGAVFGNVIGGELLMRYDIQTLFLGTSIAGFIWTIVIFLYVVLRAWQQR